MPGKVSVEFLNWDGDPAVFISDDTRRAGFWLEIPVDGKSATGGEWSKMNADLAISASKNAFIVSEEGFVRTFGKTPPLPSLDARSK